MLPNDQFFATLDGIDDHLLLHRMTARECLGRLSSYDLEIYSEVPDLALETVVGKPLTICVERTNGTIRFFNGIITSIARAGVQERYEVLRAIVSPKLWLAQHTRNCRIFQDSTIPEVVRAVLDPVYLTVSPDRLDPVAYKKWDYLVQYRESDFDFVSRLLEQEGIYYYFQHTQTQHTMVLADSLASHDPVEGYDVVPVGSRDESGHERDRITSWHVVRASRSARVATQTHDFRFPRGANLRGEGRVEPDRFHPGEDELEIYDYREHNVILENKTDPEGDFTAPAVREEGERYAKNLVDAEGVDRERYTGEGNLRGLEAGALFRIDDVAAPEGNLLVVSTELTVCNVNFQSAGVVATSGDERPCTMSFSAIRERVPYRSAATTPKPLACGPETAIVIGPEQEEIHTDKHGRIRVRFHWEREEHDSCWLRVAQIWAGANWGAMFIPRVGHEVIVMFLGGDPDRPIVTGSVYNADNGVPYALPQHATVSTIKSRSSPHGSPRSYNELRFQDRKGCEQVFVHSQGRMDVLVRGSQYETAGGNREECVGHDDAGDFNRLVVKDINEHNKGGQFELVEKKLNQNVLLEVVQVFENNHTIAVTERQTLNAREIAVEAKEALSLKGDQVTVQGAASLSLKAGSVRIEGTQNISLKCGGSFVVLTPSGVFINGSTVFINSGGGPQSAGAPLTLVDPTLETPLDALSATSGIPGSSGGGGGAGGGRTRTSRTVRLQRAPEPPPPPPRTPTGTPGGDPNRAFIDIAWVEQSTYCGGPATLRGSTRGYTDGSSETAEVRNVDDGAVVVGVPIAIAGNAFNQNVDVRDWLPRESGGVFETSRDVDAFAAGQKTLRALRLKFVPNANAGDCSLTSPTGVHSRFPMEVRNYICRISSALRYVEGWFGWIIALGNTVPAGTGGQLGSLYGSNDWRFAREEADGSRSFWDGTRWQPVPATWQDTDGTRLYGNGLWQDGSVSRAQMGGNWPDPLPAWGDAERARAATTFPQWEGTTASTWSNRFDLRRQGCSSTAQQCCRYSVQAGISFNRVTSMADGVIIVGANNGRSNSGAFSLSQGGQMAAHEFGHHLGNPDEYQGAQTVDTTVNTDGATAGIDNTAIMGIGTAAKARHFNIIKQHLADLIRAQEGVSWTFDAVAHI